MLKNLVTLARREIWEHRAIVMTPMIVGGLVVLAVTIFLIGAGLLRGIGFDTLVKGIAATGPDGSATGFSVLVLTPVIVFTISLFFMVFFYSLDALYAERKDRSILFWRSLPITDSETVLSKLLTASVVAPFATFAGLALTQLAILVVSTVVIWAGGGDAGELIWGPVPIMQIFGFSLYTLVAWGIWSLPFVAWFLLCSAWVKKSPFLWAVLPFVLVPLLERLAFRTSYFFEIVYGHIGKFFAIAFQGNTSAIRFGDSEDFLSSSNINPAALIDFSGLLGSVDVWAGALVAAALIAATIYVRRYRTEADS